MKLNNLANSKEDSEGELSWHVIISWTIKRATISDL